MTHSWSISLTHSPSHTRALLSPLLTDSPSHPLSSHGSSRSKAKPLSLSVVSLSLPPPPCLPYFCLSTRCVSLSRSLSLSHTIFRCLSHRLLSLSLTLLSLTCCLSLSLPACPRSLSCPLAFSLPLCYSLTRPRFLPDSRRRSLPTLLAYLSLK